MKAALLAFLGLMGLLAFTVGLAYVPLGRWNLVLALAIAFAKAILIVLVFMEWRREETATRLAAFVGMVWLAILFLLVGTDVGTRMPGILLGH